MGSISDYAELKILDHIVGKTSFTMPTAYVALYTAAPSDAGGGTPVSGGSYARVATSGSSWAAAASGANSNAAVITFPTATADWGTITHFALFDASSGGNMLVWGALSVSKVIITGDTARFAIGDLTLTLD
jgi:hypothetical protein